MVRGFGVRPGVINDWHKYCMLVSERSACGLLMHARSRRFRDVVVVCCRRSSLLSSLLPSARSHSCSQMIRHEWVVWMWSKHTHARTHKRTADSASSGPAIRCDYIIFDSHAMRAVCECLRMCLLEKDRVVHISAVSPAAPAVLGCVERLEHRFDRYTNLEGQLSGWRRSITIVIISGIPIFNVSSHI